MSEQPVPFAMKCNATGPGIGGGAAGVEAQFTITCADEDGARIITGGAKIQISVLRVGLHASTSGDCPIPTRIVDNNDGSYTCGYTVDGRGDYSVSAELDGSPIAGSPYPVFFSGIPGQMTSVSPSPGSSPGSSRVKAVTRQAPPRRVSPSRSRSPRRSYTSATSP